MTTDTTNMKEPMNAHQAAFLLSGAEDKLVEFDAKIMIASAFSKISDDNAQALYSTIADLKRQQEAVIDGAQAILPAIEGYDPRSN